MPRPLLRELANTLLEETKAGKLKWTSTAVKNAFRLSLAAKTIQVKQEDEYDPNTGQEDTFCQIEVLNEKDERIDSLKAYTAPDYPLLSALYDEARANALDIDGQLGDVLKELKEGR